MEPQIETLLSEVPAGFVPTFDVKPDDERIVGQLADLDVDTRRMVVGTFYFLVQANALLRQTDPLMEQANVLNEAHELEHAREGFVPGGEACDTHRKEVAALQEQIWAIQEQSESLAEKMQTLQASSGPALFQQLKLEPGERLTFRIEGITAAPPEDPFLTMIQRLAGQGVGISVIDIGPDGHLRELIPEARGRFEDQS